MCVSTGYYVVYVVIKQNKTDVKRKEMKIKANIRKGHTYSKSMDQPGKVASAARGQLNRRNEYFPVHVRV